MNQRGQVLVEFLISAAVVASLIILSHHMVKQGQKQFKKQRHFYQGKAHP
jgi:hypothetical protein